MQKPLARTQECAAKTSIELISDCCCDRGTISRARLDRRLSSAGENGHTNSELQGVPAVVPKSRQLKGLVLQKKSARVYRSSRSTTSTDAQSANRAGMRSGFSAFRLYGRLSGHYPALGSLPVSRLSIRSSIDIPENSSDAYLPAVILIYSIEDRLQMAWSSIRGKCDALAPTIRASACPLPWTTPPDAVEISDEKNICWMKSGRPCVPSLG
jgi:hypothetical protein